jgi:hypothetical protein
VHTIPQFWPVIPAICVVIMFVLGGWDRTLRLIAIRPPPGSCPAGEADGDRQAAAGAGSGGAPKASRGTLEGRV